jgi:hypothetical protein
MQAWQVAATSDPEILTNWFTRLYQDHGVGLAMGHQPDGRQLVAIDVDEHDPAHSGAELLHQLEQEYGPLPLGPRAVTGAGGAHILLQTTVAVRNGTLGPGLDIRGEGGQIVVAPTIHPVTGIAYH